MIKFSENTRLGANLEILLDKTKQQLAFCPFFVGSYVKNILRRTLV